MKYDYHNKLTSPHIVTNILFLIMRTFKIYSHSNFQIYNMVLLTMGFPGGSDGKESTCNAGDLGSIPGLGRFLGKGKGYPLQDSGLKNPKDCI